MKLPALLFILATPVGALAQSSAPATQVAVDPTATVPAANSWVPLTAGQKTKRRIYRVVEPMSLLGSAVSAGFDQWSDIPHQWGQGTEGYAIRFASAEGNLLAHNTVALGFDLALHTDPRYHPMPDGRFRARLWNAVSQSFLAYKDSGGRTINIAEIGGNYGAGFISNAWQPSGHNTAGDALMRGTSGLAFHTLKNVAREFLPDVMHHMRHNKTPSAPNSFTGQPAKP